MTHSQLFAVVKLAVNVYIHVFNQKCLRVWLSLATIFILVSVSFSTNNKIIRILFIIVYSLDSKLVLVCVMTLIILS